MCRGRSVHPAAVGLRVRRRRLSARFAFTPAPLNATGDTRRLREVQPALNHLAAWISAVGAGVGLGDFDGDGLPNDRCLVDPRDDSVTVAPVPGTGERYAAVTLQPAGVAYDARTTAPMGCLPADFNGDGALDVLVYFWGRVPLLYLRGPGGGAPGAAGAGRATWSLPARSGTRPPPTSSTSTATADWTS
ncbi:VCBS repeat-containing protein [Micromonospora sp. BRA006-A]|nr:VCBS repeat-containing protein [Micromonospora sp. BRA006-A]